MNAKLQDLLEKAISAKKAQAEATNKFDNEMNKENAKALSLTNKAAQSAVWELQNAIDKATLTKDELLDLYSKLDAA